MLFFIIFYLHKIKMYLLIVAALAGLVYYQHFKSFIKDFKLKFIDIVIDAAKTKEANYKKLFFYIRFDIDNKTKFAANAKSYELKIYADSKLIGTVTQDQTTTLQPETTTKLNIPIGIKTVATIKIIRKLFTGATEQIQIIGKINLTLGELYINEQKTITLQDVL